MQSTNKEELPVSDSGAVTKQTLVGKISELTELDHKVSLGLVNQIVSEIISALGRGDDVLISGFGKFVLLDKKSREGRNPLTGENVTIKARKVVKLRASDQLKEILASAATNK